MSVEFERCLKAQKRCNVRQILCYAKKYHTVLQTGDGSTIVNLQSPAVRRHVLESLTIYSKYIGKYNIWKDICTKYQLKWGNSEQDNLRYFINYLHGSGNLDQMIGWLKDTLNKVLPQVGNVLLYNTLTGLRPTESLLSIRLIQTDFDNYTNQELGILQNFKYPEFISKKTKKSYITVYDSIILDIARNCIPLIPSWDAIRSHLKRRGVSSIHTKYCRAIFATYLRKSRVEQEIIDIYQGRVPSTIFQAHYMKTNIKEDRERILNALHKLKQEISLK